MVDVGRVRIIRVAVKIVCLVDAEAIQSVGSAIFFDARNIKCEFGSSLGKSITTNENVAAARAEVSVGQCSRVAELILLSEPVHGASSDVVGTDELAPCLLDEVSIIGRLKSWGDLKEGDEDVS